MIPERIQHKADALLAALAAGTIRPRKLSGFAEAQAINVTRSYRLYRPTKQHEWQLLSHEDFNHVGRKHMCFR